MNSVKIHTAAEIEMARAAGQAAAQVLAMITPHVRPGITTEELDDICHDFIVNELKVTPANIGYHGYTVPPARRSIMWSATASRPAKNSRMAISLISM